MFEIKKTNKQKNKDNLLFPEIHLVSSHEPNEVQTLNGQLWIGTGIQNGTQGAANVFEDVLFEIQCFHHFHPTIQIPINIKRRSKIFIIIID